MPHHNRCNNKKAKLKVKTAANPDPEGKFVVLTHLCQKVKTSSPLVLLGLCELGIWIVG